MTKTDPKNESTPTVEILSQGNEVIEGRILDTNTAWLSRKLSALGFQVIRHSSVPDQIELLSEVLEEITLRCDLCLCTGGLGPTIDDLTTKAASIAFDRELLLDPIALEQIESWFKRSGRTMPGINRKQAFLPFGATRLDNLWGTAPGFMIETCRTLFFFLPGVPREMEGMFKRWVIPELENRFGSLPAPRTWVFQTVGIGESTLESQLSALSLPPRARLGFRAKGMEVEVKVSFDQSTSDIEMATCRQQIEECLGPCLFAVQVEGKGSQGLADFVGKHLRQSRLKVYAVESLSSGNLCLALTRASVLAKGEIHPQASPPLPIENEEIIRLELQSHAEELLHKRHADVVLLERWYPLEENEAEEFQAVLWTAAIHAKGSLIKQRRLRGVSDQIRNSAAVISLDVMRQSLELISEKSD